MPGLVELLRADEALRPDDLRVDAAHAHLVAVRAAPHEAVLPADAEVDFADGEGPAAVDAEPAGQELGLRPGVEDEVSWRVEDAGHRDLAVARCRDLQLRGVGH